MKFWVSYWHLLWLLRVCVGAFQLKIFVAEIDNLNYIAVFVIWNVYHDVINSLGFDSLLAKQNETKQTKTKKKTWAHFISLFLSFFLFLLALLLCLWLSLLLLLLFVLNGHSISLNYVFLPANWICFQIACCAHPPVRLLDFDKPSLPVFFFSLSLFRLIDKHHECVHFSVCFDDII